MEILKTTNLKKYYGRGESLVKALDDVNVTVESGQFVAIIGTSGSGKSTLLNMLGGLDTPTSGGVTVEDRSVEKYQGPGDCHPLLLTAGQMAWIVFELALQLQKLYDLLQKLYVLRPAVQTYGQHDVLIGREVGDQIIVLEYKADALSAKHGELFPAHLLHAPVLHGKRPRC